MSIFDKSIKFGKSIFTGSIFVILCLANFAYSQVTTGQIAGVVTDPNGAVVTGASVKATNTDTNSVRETTTSGTGVYSFQLLPPGRYREFRQRLPVLEKQALKRLLILHKQLMLMSRSRLAK